MMSSSPASAPDQFSKARTPIHPEVGSSCTNQQSATTVPDSASPPLSIGMAVRLAEPQSYLKTADAMAMLRPGDLIDDGEDGEVVALLPLHQAAVRFRRGTFVLTSELLLPLSAEEPHAANSTAER